MLFEHNLADVPILSAFGNNDPEFHYQAQTGNGEQNYYEAMFDMWFTEHTANNKLEDFDTIKDTFLQGGWYRVTLIPGELTLLSLNSLQFNDEMED